MTVTFSARLPLSMALLGSLVLAGCVAPGNFSQTGEKGKLIDTATAPTFTASSGAGKAVASIGNRGELSARVVDMPRVERELAGLLQPLVDQWPHEMPRPPKVKVRMASTYHAVTYADGTIVVDLGSLDDLSGQINAKAGQKLPFAETDQELQYLLGHEFAHYAMAHHSKTDRFDQFLSTAATTVRYANTASAIGELRYQKIGGDYQLVIEDEEKIESDISQTVGAYDLLSVVIAEGLSPAWNRVQEDEADVLALDLMVGAGVYGQSYGDVFLKMSGQETLREQLINASKAKADAAKTQLMSEDAVKAAFDGSSEAYVSRIADETWKQFQVTVMRIGEDYLTSTHRNPQVRLDGVSAYEETAHPEIIFETPVITTSALDAIRRDPQFRDAKTSTVAYFNAVDARAKGDFRGAEAYFQQAYSTEFGKQGPILFEGGRIMEALGNIDRAMKRYQMAIDVDETPLPDAFRRLARLQAGKGRYSAALGTIGRGEGQLGDRPYFLPLRIMVAVRQEQADLVISLLDECEASKRKEIVPACIAESNNLSSENLTPEQLRALGRQNELGIELPGSIGGWLGNN